MFKKALPCCRLIYNSNCWLKTIFVTISLTLRYPALLSAHCRSLLSLKSARLCLCYKEVLNYIDAIHVAHRRRSLLHFVSMQLILPEVPSLSLPNNQLQCTLPHIS